MQARFLLGPAGSGKTFRCLAEIRAALQEGADTDTDASELILLAPKQATFQLERQLLDSERWGERPREPQATSSDGSPGFRRDEAASSAQAGVSPHPLSGYTRLHIFSFERLARFVFERLNVAPPQLLAEEGRVMVLRALLMQHGDELKLFRRSARRPGFARQLGRLLGELQQHQFTPAKLRALASRHVIHPELQGKLNDLARLHENYARWLAEHELEDANRLLDAATEVLRHRIPDAQPSTLNFAGLWLDGFAEMTPQELDLLAAILPHGERATLAFCLESEPGAETPWLSIWSMVGKTFQRCRQRLENLAGCKISVELLKRKPGENRFAQNAALRRLESGWQRGAGFQPDQDRLDACPTLNNNLEIVVCQNPEAEAAFAAREILKYARADKRNRFRDCAVLVRDLEGYHKPLARAFHRCGIPFFLDRRESVAHHPLAELTRSALRTVALDWRHDDWFAALKTGFCSVEETEIDRLENAALEFGWRGRKWREPLPTGDVSLERLRRNILPPFENFSARLAQFKNSPTGRQLADALRELWGALRVEEALERWSTAETVPSSVGNRQSSIHLTVWEQMNVWLDNLALAFPREALPLRDWLPILEAGLSALTVGVIPPVLDEVLIGAVDRSRNPNLKFALVLGVNESVFPAAPAAPPILTDADRDELEQAGVTIGPDLRERLARERYYGYIACTRASEKLAVTFARHGSDGKTLNPSAFIPQLQRILPSLEIEKLQAGADWREAEHASELVAPLAASLNVEAGRAVPGAPGRRDGDIASCQRWIELAELPALKALAENLAQLREPDPMEDLPAGLAERLYGPVLRTSVSRLEEFAQCPFRFFVSSGLRAAERKVFELDARERGSFQHEVLKKFHDDLGEEGFRWRDLTPSEARERIRAMALERTEHFRGGLLRDTAQTRFEARVLAESLQDFVEVIVSWMRGQYEFDPAAAELDFGGDAAPAPAWEIELDSGHRLALRGRIDRIDLCPDPAGRGALAVVVDYKAGGKKLDALLVEHGVQLQLPAYLGVLRHWANPRDALGVARLVPAGVFYVNLRGQYERGGTRDEALEDAGGARKRAYRHTGRFDASVLPELDRLRAADQFNYRLNNDGTLRKGSVEALPRAAFEEWLDRVEAQLREMGRAIFSGAAGVDPYRKGAETPCEYCDYRAVCRIDPWTHRYRVLRAPPKDISS